MSTRKYLAEFVGTFLFLTIGYLSVPAFAVASAPTPNLLVVPFAFSFGLLAAIFAFGHISGGHFNPAVTVAAVLDGRTTPVDAVGYIVAQIVGALAAAGVVFVAVSQAAVAAGVTKPGTGITDTGALIIEVLLTAGFVAVILAATKHATSLAALAIPLTLVGDPFRLGDVERRVGQPGPVHRLGRGRRRRRGPVDLHRRADHRRGARLGRLSRGRAAGRAAGRLTA